MPPCIPKVSKNKKNLSQEPRFFFNWQPLCKRRYAGCVVPIFYLLTALSLFFIFSWPFFPPVWLPIGLFFLRIVLRSDCATHSTFPAGPRPQPHVFASAMSVSCSRFSDKLVNVCVFLYVTGRRVDGLAGVRPVDFLSCGNMAV